MESHSLGGHARDCVADKLDIFVVLFEPLIRAVGTNAAAAFYYAVLYCDIAAGLSLEIFSEDIIGCVRRGDIYLKRLLQRVAFCFSDGNKLTAVYSYLFAGDKLDVYSGNDDQIVPFLSMGAKGVISVLSNVIPAETREICTKFWEGDTAGAAALQCKYNELVKALFCEVNPIPVKEALAMMGWCDPIIRSPLYRMEEANLERLRKAMVDLGIIEG